MRPLDSLDHPVKPTAVQAPQPSRMQRFSAILLKMVEFGFFLATVLVLDRDKALTHPLSRPILWMALVILPCATIHVAATMQQNKKLKLISVPLYHAGTAVFALIWPLVISVFLFRDFFGMNQAVWMGISLVTLLVTGIVLIQAARHGKQAFTIQGSKWPAIILAILIGIACIMTILSLLR